MRKAKNVFSILGIVFGAIALAAFILLPYINAWIPVNGAVGDITQILPTMQMIMPNQLFDFVGHPFTFQFLSYTAFDWTRIGIFAGLLIFVILLIIWLIVLLVKGKPGQLIWWLFMIIGIAAIADVVMINLIHGLSCTDPVEATDPYVFSYTFGDVVGADKKSFLEYCFFYVSNDLGTVTINDAASVFSPIVIYVMLGSMGVATLGGLFSILGIFFNLAWLKGVSDEEYEESFEESIPEEPQEETPAESIPEEVPAIAEEAPTMSAVEEVKEPEIEEQNPFKVVRRILVHKSGKVIRVLNEHYYDVTTDIFVEPGYAEPHDPNETEQMHYEKILSAKGGVASVKPEPKPVVAPVAAPVSEQEAYERISFEKRIKSADKDLKGKYNELKSEILSYGVKSRVAAGGDTFRLHTKTYVKLTIAGKSIKLYLALNPKDYKNSTIPFADASKKNLYKDIPFVFKVKSDLSLRRAKQLIAETMAKDGLVQEKVEKHDWVKDL